ncbi:MAG TPA: type II secretion system protein GspM [Thiolinea sp.]|nr:type II secretion system protein GspM [Thiolinea sp.]
MKAWFSALSERERHLVLIVATLITTLLLFFYGWKPLQRYKLSLENDLAATIEDRSYLDQARQQVAVLEAMEEAKPRDLNTSVQLLSAPLLRRFRLDAGGVLVRSEAKSKDALSLKLEGAQFDQLIRFLSAMENEHGIYVETMALIPSETPGLTGAQLTLKR